MRRATLPALGCVLLMCGIGRGDDVLLLVRPADPHGSPRPARGATDVPRNTSLYFELALSPATNDDEVDPASVEVRLIAAGEAERVLLGAAQRFAAGASGWLRRTRNLQGQEALAVYVEPGFPLKPATQYEARVLAASRAGKLLNPNAAAWTFTTESAQPVPPATLQLDFRTPPVSWQGGFFTGLCNVVFCSDLKTYQSTYDLMNQARHDHPRAWTYQRDFWTTGTEFTRPGLLPQRLPNIVRERETRRIAAMTRQDHEVVLRLEDVFGHDQYGIPGGRPPRDDYQAGDEVLIADGTHDARARVLRVDEPAGSVVVEAVDDPADGWNLAYDGPLPSREDPDAPGLFAPGGCYLRKFAPCGTPCYYWGRLDRQYDLVHRRNGQRVMVNLADATGDLARDGRGWTTAKDLAEWHEVVQAITSHLIERYGEPARHFTWSVFNEPDLGPLFWRASWEELQAFYDYTVDAVLRAFEDHGHDSKDVLIGGLELGGIFGTNLKLDEFLAHCSPDSLAPGGIEPNAAYADPRLAGKRSARVEALCAAHGGRGSPCDFISIHSYNRAAVMAAKLARAKQRALELDPKFFADLRINSHESCPDWMPPPDEAAADSYLGNGYFETWCLDVAARQLRQAALDPRYARGETLLTVWPPAQDLSGLNVITRILHPDAGEPLTVPSPVFHVLNLLSDLGPDYWVTPEVAAGGQALGAYGSREGGLTRVLVYTHGEADTQSRAERKYPARLVLAGMAGAGAAFDVAVYRFDRDHNSAFRRIRALRNRGDTRKRVGFMGPPLYPSQAVEEIRAASMCVAEPAARVEASAEGRGGIDLELPGNGAVFLVIRRVEEPPRQGE